jgi:photosystem II stability/assembly factor-like uncharacterized protein
MANKLPRLLIPSTIIILLFFGSYILSTGQAPANSVFIPVVNNDLSGWLGPDGGSIVSIAVDPLNPQVIYAGTWGSGVFKSQDGGESWHLTSQGLDNLFINSLAIDPVEPSTIYAGTYKSKLYKSVDAGNSWVLSANGMQDKAIVYTIVIDPLSHNIVYAGTRGISNNGNPPWKGVVYKSIDAGLNWSPVLTDVGGVNQQDWAYSLAVEPVNHSSVFAAMHEYGPYHSLTYGNSWNSAYSGIDDYSGRAIVINPDTSNGTILYYGVWHDDAVYKSYNGSNSWSPINRDIKYTKVYGMAIDPIHTDTVYLATFTRGVLKTIDGGNYWNSSGLTSDLIYTIAVDPISPAKVFAGTAGDGFQLSLNSGVSWQASNTGIENSTLTTVLVSPTNPERIFASVLGAGVYQSYNHGRDWTQYNTGLGDKFVHSMVQDPSSPKLIYALTDTGGLYQNDTNTTNGWVKVGQGLPLAEFSTPAFPADHPLATYEMEEYFPDPAEINTVNQPTSAILLTMVYAPSSQQTAYMGTGGSGVYKSTNGGTSWTTAGLTGETVPSIAVDPTNSNLVYAATNTPGSLKISQNGGGIWTDASLAVTFYSLATSLASPGILYAGTSNGIYSYQAGTWVNLGLEGMAVTALATDPVQPDKIFAGTTSGAYYSTDGGLSWKFVDQDLTGYTIQSINIDPIRNSWIYFSTKTHGIYLATILH